MSAPGRPGWRVRLVTPVQARPPGVDLSVDGLGLLEGRQVTWWRAGAAGRRRPRRFSGLGGGPWLLLPALVVVAVIWTALAASAQRIDQTVGETTKKLALIDTVNSEVDAAGDAALRLQPSVSSAAAIRRALGDARRQLEALDGDQLSGEERTAVEQALLRFELVELRAEQLIDSSPTARADQLWNFLAQIEAVHAQLDEAGDLALEEMVEFADGAHQAIVVALVAVPLLVLGMTAASLVLARRADRRRRALELELRRAQKLESVGQLAAGVAHEINTPIQFVGDNLRFLHDAFGELLEAVRPAPGAQPPAEAGMDVEFLAQEVPLAVAQALEGVERVATIVRAMKAFGHPTEAGQRANDLNEALRNTITVARNELKYAAEVQTDLADLPPVVCNLGDLNQVFLNLLVNAAHAIAEVVAEGERGRITVRTRPAGPDVVIVVEDTGGGIPEAVRERVFDPFFTTKEVGRGTGQGLALARTIIEQHRGSIEFETEVGRGTTFTIRLPVAGAAGASSAAVEDGDLRRQRVRR
jgi:signal transduction histidine kinase